MKPTRTMMATLGLCLIMLSMSGCGAATPAAPPTDTPAPPTATATNTAVPPTPTATNTAVPPTATATATATSTATSAPTDTPPPTATATTAATATPAATNTLIPPPVVVVPTNTPRPVPPTATAAPASQVTVKFNFQGYDRWGRPAPGDCSRKDNSSPVMRLTWDVFVTNNSSTPVTVDDWTVPVSLNNLSAAVIATCYYEPPTVAPGQTVKATFTSYVEQGQWVSAVGFTIRKVVYTACLDKTPAQVAC